MGKIYKPGQIITIKPDGIHNKRFRITKVTTSWNICTICKETNMDIRHHDYEFLCPMPLTCYLYLPKNCYPKPID